MKNTNDKYSLNNKFTLGAPPTQEPEIETKCATSGAYHVDKSNMKKVD